MVFPLPRMSNDLSYHFFLISSLSIANLVLLRKMYYYIFSDYMQRCFMVLKPGT